MSDDTSTRLANNNHALLSHANNLIDEADVDLVATLIPKNPHYLQIVVMEAKPPGQLLWARRQRAASRRAIHPHHYHCWTFSCTRRKADNHHVAANQCLVLWWCTTLSRQIRGKLPRRGADATTTLELQ